MARAASPRVSLARALAACLGDVLEGGDRKAARIAPDALNALLDADSHRGGGIAPTQGASVELPFGPWGGW